MPTIAKPQRALGALLLYLMGWMPMACSEKQAPCDSYCTLRADCCASLANVCRDTDAIPTCTATCLELIEADAAYQSALTEKVACMEDASECSEILLGCVPDGD